MNHFLSFIFRGMTLQLSATQNDHKISFTLDGHKGHVTSLSVSLQQLLLSTCSEGTAQLWNVQNCDDPRSVGTLSVNCGITSSAFCENWVVLSGGDGSVHMFDTVSGRRKRLPQRPRTSVINDVACDGEVIAFGGDEGSVIFCDPRSPQMIRECQCGAPVTALGVGAGQWFCGLADGRILELGNGGNVVPLHSHRDVVTGLTVSGGIVATRDMCGTVKLWNSKPFASSRRIIAEMDFASLPFPLLSRLHSSGSGMFLGHSDGSCEMVSWDGRRVWSKSNVHRDAVTSVVPISENVAAASGWDGTVVMFST